MSAKELTLSEEASFCLYQAKHLTWLLVCLTDRPNNAYPEIDINIESLSVVMGILHEKLDFPVK